MSETVSPTLRRRELGHRLRELRLAANLTLEQVAAHCGFSLAKASRLETGDRGVSVNDLRALLELYHAPVDEHSHLVALARQSKERGWWQAYGVPYGTYIGLESSACAISEYNPSVVPGLLQTRDYAIALALGAGIEAAEAQRLADVRITRQGVLGAERPPEFSVVIDEAALRLVVGDGALMRRQLHALIVAATRNSTVALQVMPFAAGPHPSLNSNFVILTFDGNIPTVVYIEGLHGSFYLEKESDIVRYRAVFDKLRRQALDADASLQLISEIMSHHAQEREET